MKIETNENWRIALLRDYSSWALWLVLGFAIAPDLIYLTTGIDTNPAVWSVGLLGAVTLGLIGKVLKQTEYGKWVRRTIIGVLVLIFVAFGGPALAMGMWPQSVHEEPEYKLGEPTWLQTADVLTPLVAKWEGKRNKAYFDLVGVPTICYGHTRTISADDVRAGVTWSDERCEELLRDELHEYWSETRKGFTPDTIDGRLTPDRDAAYASLAFNVGWGGVRGSTATKRLNAGDVPGGCEALTWWNKAGGRVVRGLVNRRTEEHELCMKGLVRA